MSHIIEARGLTRRYGEFLAVDRVDFHIAEGEFFGMLGPNGAGKTSTIKMISCVLPITDGALTVDGFDARVHDREIKARLGVVSQEDNLDPDLSVRKNLEVYARYFDIPRAVAAERIDDAMTLLQIDNRAGEPIMHLSGGLKRRLVIARALVNEPRVLILDEPTTGLDPQARHLVWRKLRRLRERGTTILLTTHYMDEAEQLCDRLVIMDRGQILEEGRPRDLVRRHVGREVVEVQATDAEAARLRAGIDDALTEDVRMESFEDMHYIFGADATIAERLEAAVHDPYRVVHRRANLEDVFLTLTGRGLGEAE